MFAGLKLRALLPALIVAAQFAVLPCAMAMPMESAGDCEHCDTAARPSHCMVAADQSAVDANIGSHDRLRDAPPSADVFSVLPWPAVPRTLQRAESGATAIARRTGRHSGDPPLNLLYGSFLN
jgi:hypothetical protein